MCYYIGIEDLAANAMIEILEKKQENDATDESFLCIKFKDLKKYGAEVIKYINNESNEKALLILSRASTIHMFRNYSDYFEQSEDGSAVKLKDNKTVQQLKQEFRSYIAMDLINAYASDSAKKVLYGIYCK